MTSLRVKAPVPAGERSAGEQDGHQLRPEHPGEMVLGAARQTGGAIGVALLGTLVAGPAFVVGLHAAMAVSAAAFLSAAIVTGVAVGRPAIISHG